MEEAGSASNDAIPLSSIMSYEESAANLGTYREQAIQAIESLRQLRGELYGIILAYELVALRRR